MRRDLKRLANIKLADFKNTYSIPADERPRCAICATPQKDKRLARDHCHETGLRRGDLCSRCNMAIGSFNDDIDLMRNAINYLRHYGKKAA